MSRALRAITQDSGPHFYSVPHSFASAKVEVRLKGIGAPPWGWSDLPQEAAHVRSRPKAPTGTRQQVGSYLRYTARDPDVVERQPCPYISEGNVGAGL